MDHQIHQSLKRNSVILLPPRHGHGLPWPRADTMVIGLDPEQGSRPAGDGPVMVRSTQNPGTSGLTQHSFNFSFLFLQPGGSNHLVKPDPELPVLELALNQSFPSPILVPTPLGPGIADFDPETASSQPVVMSTYFPQ